MLTAATIVALFLFAGPLFYLTNEWLLDDSYFHLRCALEYLSHGKLTTLWLSQGVLAEYTVDKEPLFHLIPVAILYLISDPIIAFRYYGLLLCLSISIIMFIHVRDKYVLLLYAIGSFAYWGRLCLTRPHLLSILMFLLFLLFLKQRRLKSSLLLMILYPQSYSVPVILIVTWIAYCVLDKQCTQRFLEMLKGIAATTVGFVLSPYFPNNVYVLKFQFIDALVHGVTAAPSEVPSELLPLDTRSFVVAAFVSAIAIYFAYNLGMSSPYQRMLRLMTLLFLCVSLQYSRFIEYVHPTSCVLLGTIVSKEGAHAIVKRLKGGPVVMGMIAILLFGNFKSAYQFIGTVKKPDYCEIGDLLSREYTKEVVYNAEWDAYPKLVYFCKQNRFVIGQDPAFVLAKSPAIYRDYLEVNRAQSVERVRTLLKETFKSRLLVVKIGSPLHTLIANSSHFKILLRSGETALGLALSNKDDSRQLNLK